jgi:hypothetical protein
MASPGPRTLALMVVRDENDIMAANLHHHARLGIDAFVIIDHGSNDGTFETLEKMRRDGFPLTCLRQDRDMVPDVDAWYALLFAEAHRQKGDRALLIDADEFWLPSRGSFSTLDFTGPVITAQRFNMMAPRAALSASGSVLESHVYRVCHPFPPDAYRQSVVHGTDPGHPDYPILMTALQPKVLFKLDAIAHPMWAGHGVVLTTGEQAMPPCTGHATIFHYPLRSFAQFDRKIETFARIFDRTPSLGRETSWQTRYLCQLRERGQLENEFQRYFPSPPELLRLITDGVLVHDPRIARLPSLSSSPLEDAAPLNPSASMQGQIVVPLNQARQAQTEALMALTAQVDTLKARITGRETEGDMPIVRP